MSDKNKPLTDDQISALFMSYYDESTQNETDLQEDRRKILKEYRREPYGDELEGWSRVVTSEMRDSVAWCLPALLEVFFGPEFPARFNARNAEDIDQAQLETDYCLNVINQQNPGFLMMYIWLKDCLIQKNGYVHSYWDEKVEEEKEEYEGLNEEEYQVLLLDSDIEIVGHTLIDEAGQEYDEETAPQDRPLIHHLEVVRHEDNSKVRIDNLPPENVFVDSDHQTVDLRECMACGFESHVTRSDLIVDGYDKKLINSIAPVNSDDETEEKSERDKWNYEKQREMEQARKADPSREKIRIIQGYMRLDIDGDGRTELCFIKLAGNNGQHVLEKDQISSVGMHCITPEVEPHEHVGVSIAELARDIQRISTVVTRQVLNNLYLTNHPQTEYVKGQVNYNDLITRAPGSTIAVKATGSVQTVTTPFMAGASLPIFDELSKRTEKRIGISEQTQGLDPDALADATNTIGTKILNAAQARIQLMGRLIAETGFKSLFLNVHEIVCQHDRERLVDFGAGNFKSVDPRKWRKRTGMTIQMGPGFADRIAKRLALQTIQDVQREIFANQQGDGPLLGIEHIHNSITDSVKMAGIADPSRYFRDPREYQAPQETKEDPISEAIEVEKLRTAAKSQSEEADRQLKREIHEDEMALKEFETEERLKLEEAKLDDAARGRYDKGRFERSKAGQQGEGTDRE